MRFAALSLLLVVLLNCSWVHSQGDDVNLDDLLKEIFTQPTNSNLGQLPTANTVPVQPASSGNPLIRPQAPSTQDNNVQSTNNQVSSCR